MRIEMRQVPRPRGPLEWLVTAVAAAAIIALGIFFLAIAIPLALIGMVILWWKARKLRNAPPPPHPPRAGPTVIDVEYEVKE